MITTMSSMVSETPSTTMTVTMSSPKSRVEWDNSLDMCHAISVYWELSPYLIKYV